MAVEVINTRYEVLETISTPDSGPYVVYKARDVQEGRVVTLKVAPPALVADVPDLLNYLKLAVRTASPLQHPMVSRIYDAGRLDDGSLYIVSDFVRGISLRERIRRIAPFSLAVATDIAVAVAEALTAAHRAGIVHGRLLPEAITLSPEGQIRVGEFVAGRYLRDVAPGAEGMSAPYRPPEASFDEESAPTDDIFALGAILYEMMTGVQPAEAHGDLPTSPRTLNPAIPPALEGITLKALHPDTTVRYEDAPALLADLQAARAALRSGRPLTWSPLAGVKVGASTVQPRSPRNSAPRTAADYDDDMNSRRQRQGPGALAIAVWVMLVLAICGGIALFWSFDKFFSPPPDIAVPNLVGHTFDDAVQIGHERQFIPVIVKQDFSTKWPEGQIYDQDPQPGRTIKAGKQVSVYVSEGPEFLTVPDLNGMTSDKAMQTLRDSTLPPGTVSQAYSETVAKGIVIAQTPAAHTNVSKYTAVNFTVSEGKQPPDTPTNVVANPVSPNKVEITWTASPRAVKYKITRIVDGTLSVVGSAVKDLKFDDTGLQPNTSYSYTVTAVNAVGESAPTDPTLAITPPSAESGSPDGSTGSVTEGAGSTDDTGAGNTVAPPDDTGADTTQTDTGASGDQQRQFHIAFRLPRHPGGDHRVRIDVVDTTGTSMVYDEMHHAGDLVDVTEPGVGSKITVRIYVDDALMKQQVL